MGEFRSTEPQQNFKESIEKSKLEIADKFIIAKGKRSNEFLDTDIRLHEFKKQDEIKKQIALRDLRYRLDGIGPSLSRSESAQKVAKSLVSLCARFNPKDENSLDSEIAKLTLKTIISLLPNLEQSIKNNILSINEGLQLYCVLVDYGDDNQKKIGADALSDHLDSIESNLSDDESLDACVDYLGKVISYTDFEKSSHAEEIVFNKLGRDGYNHNFPRLASLLFISPVPDTASVRRVEDFLDSFQLPSENIYSAWQESSDWREFSQVIRDNLESIFKLEKSQPGICKFLYAEFGIADFGRYPEEVLIRQFQEFNQIGNQYGLVIFPRNDWNGAFYQRKDMIKDLHRQLSGKFNLRIFECESKIDIARALIKCDRRYNPPGSDGHKISLLILGGHGNEESIDFGGDDEIHVLSSDDLSGSGVQRSGNFFDQNPTIILDSCSTGADAGIGQELSKRFGARVIAPKTPTSLDKLYAIQKPDQKKFTFNARYSANGVKSIYKAGLSVKHASS